MPHLDHNTINTCTLCSGSQTWPENAPFLECDDEWLAHWHRHHRCPIAKGSMTHDHDIAQHGMSKGRLRLAAPLARYSLKNSNTWRAGMNTAKHHTWVLDWPSQIQMLQDPQLWFAPKWNKSPDQLDFLSPMAHHIYRKMCIRCV